MRDVSSSRCCQSCDRSGRPGNQGRRGKVDAHVLAWRAAPPLVMRCANTTPHHSKLYQRKNGGSQGLAGHEHQESFRAGAQRCPYIAKAPKVAGFELEGRLVERGSRVPAVLPAALPLAASIIHQHIHYDINGLHCATKQLHDLTSATPSTWTVENR
jgi:hypothetical protein